jgi:hypothetical protein
MARKLPRERLSEPSGSGESIVPRIVIFDPAVSHFDGVSAMAIDMVLARAASDIDWARRNGAKVERITISPRPLPTAEASLVGSLLEGSEQGALPMTLVNGHVALLGRYPDRAQIAQWAAIAAPSAVQPEEGLDLVSG